jgi:hypothetical protein
MSSTNNETEVKIKAKGTIAEVWNGLAKHTSGGLVKSDLVLNKKGKPVSKKRQEATLKMIKEGKLKPIQKQIN